MGRLNGGWSWRSGQEYKKLAYPNYCSSSSRLKQIWFLHTHIHTHSKRKNFHRLQDFFSLSNFPFQPCFSRKASPLSKKLLFLHKFHIIYSKLCSVDPLSEYEMGILFAWREKTSLGALKAQLFMIFSDFSLLLGSFCLVYQLSWTNFQRNSSLCTPFHFTLKLLFSLRWFFST